MTLPELLDLLPKMTEDGTYYELRKQDIWCCARLQVIQMGSRIGNTPEEAVSKMLTELNILGPPPSGVSMGRGATTADMKAKDEIH